MIYLTEKFPPIADLHWTPDGSSYQYTFHYRKWELAHCIFQLSADEKILYIESLARAISYPPEFKQEHLCTELLNAMLYDILCKWDIIPEKITGTLAYTDSFNGNWKKSIPFYRNFAKYLEARLPYTLTFGITDKDGYVIPSDKYEDIDEFMKEYTGEDLKFFYVVTKK